MGELPKSITERALSDVFLNGMVTMIRTGVPERDAMIATLAALSDALREMTKRAIRVAETTPPSVVIHGTPPGHVLVGQDARETLARAIMRSSPTKLVIGGASIDCVDAEAADEMASRIVNGFLAALGVRGGA